jgi:hypothetical protein
MAKQRLITRVVAPLAMVGVACFAAASLVHAYPPAAASAKLTAGCVTINSGAQAVVTFQFVDSLGNGVTGLPVSFSVSGVPGSSVSPTTGTTDPGFVSTTLTASTTHTGLVTVTATSGTVSASGTCTVVAPAGAGAGAVAGLSTGLPNTSTGAPGTNPMAYFGIGLALLILLAGAFTLRQTRRAA